MNNSQFRRLVLDTPTARPGDGTASTPRREAAVLGSKLRSNIPMTPRTVSSSAGVDFARQLAERDKPDKATRKFRSSAAPKGAKLPSGYRDRTRDRDAADGDDKAARVQALEDMMKLQQIDAATFERLRDQIVGGDLGTTHLVKGLDYKLLERVRRGEDVTKGKDDERPEDEPKEEEVEDEFEKLEKEEVTRVVREKTVRRGEMAPPPTASKKRTRDAILADLRASRQAAKDAAAAQATLGPKFRKLGDKREKARVERDERGREVLITVDEEGNVKRKVKRVRVEDGEGLPGKGLLMPDKDAEPLGMEVPEGLAKPDEEEEVGDIFEDAGSDYDPLAGLSGDEDEDEGGEERTKPRPLSPPRSTSPTAAPAPRNYFGTTATSSPPPEATPTATVNDPTILAALRKASSLQAHLPDASSTSPPSEAAARAARHAAMLSSTDRDAEDMDLGFGESRFGDAEEAEEGGKGKLAVWGVGEGGGEGGKRKRGKKKRKGDGESAADVLGVLERRKEAAKR
ncbi:MAG: hypothetical protein M1832_001464 [Thelocarpon impressellum]|nr:MAG: hypothetical protein M1832_001464 [Thelocarpon impressellum]